MSVDAPSRPPLADQHRTPKPEPKPEPAPPLPAAPAPRGWRLLSGHLRPVTARILAGGSLTLLGGLAGLAQPMAARSLIDSLGTRHSTATPAVGLAAVMLAGLLLNALGDYQLQLTAESMVRRSRTALAARLLRLPMADFGRLRQGDLISRVTSDTNLLRAAISQALVSSATSVLMVLGGLAAMFWLDPLLGTATVGMLLLVGLPAFWALPRVARAAKQAQASVGQLGSVLDRALGAFPTIKANGLEPQTTREAADASDAAWRSGVRASFWETLCGAVSGLALQIAFLTVLAVGAGQVAEHQVSVSGLITFLLYLVFVSPLLTQLVSGIAMLQRGLAAIQRIAEIESLPVEAVDPVDPPAIPAAPSGPAALAFHAVRFSYPDRAGRVLDDLTLTIPPCGLTALVGPSGAGKSTTFALIERFWEPTGGSITLDGRDLRDWPLAELRANVGFVEQDARVLAGTFRENLLLAAPDATEHDLRRVAALTRLDDLLARLPQGLDTPLGERGAALSGGQRQRVAIARALLRRPRLLLLDEPTAHLDAANEEALRETIAEISRTTTVLVIAHRIATVATADRIVVLEAGRLRAVGSHRELLAEDGLYSTLARGQLLAI